MASFGRMIAIAILVVGCGSKQPDAGGAPTPRECAPGKVRVGEACVAPIVKCGADEALVEGVCARVGIDACAPGMKSTDAGGCEPILPATACAKGTMALPGETTCHEVAPCGSGAWGDIPVTPSTVYVDAAYGGGDADGTNEKPLPTIQAGVDRAGSDGFVAVAAGSYKENLRLNRLVTIWGRCPSMVTVQGVDASLPTFDLGAAVKLHHLGITGNWIAVRAVAANGALLDRVWVHDLPERGLDAEMITRPNDVTVRSSLFEGLTYDGLFVAGGKALFDRVVVRDVAARADGRAGYGLYVARHPGEKTPAEVTLRASIVERVVESGVVALEGAKVTVEGSLVRDVRMKKDGTLGVGIVAQSKDPKVQAELVVRESVVASAHYAGITVTGSTATIERTWVRDAQPDESRRYGMGVYVFDDGVATLDRVLVERTHTGGVLVEGSKLVMKRSIVRDVSPHPKIEARGIGVGIMPGFGWTKPSEASIESTLVSNGTIAGVLVVASTCSLTGVIVRDTKKHPTTGRYGDGVLATATLFDGSSTAAPASLTIVGSLVEQSARAAVYVIASSASLTSSMLSCAAFPMEIGRAFVIDDARGEGEVVLEDGGDNRCGCGDQLVACKAHSSGLEPISAH